jgi:2-dehydropantoate 2-reductase
MAALRVAIIGPGALGRALGGVLERGGAEVGYIGRSGPVNRLPEVIDVALVTTKAYDTAAAIRAVAPFIVAADVISLQNGLGNMEAIEEVVDRRSIFGGATTHAALRRPDGSVEHVASGDTRIAPLWSVSTHRAEQIAGRLSSHGLPTTVEPSVERLLWRKLVASCGINPLTALERCLNGSLLEKPLAFARALAAAREALKVAADRGIALDMADPEPLLQEILQRTAANRSSMLQDLESGRATEVDQINGAVVYYAEAYLNRAAPVNAELVRLIKERSLTHA